MYAMVVCGNGQGLVGLGEGKHELVGTAVDKAFAQAVKSLAMVELFEGRTIWGNREDQRGSIGIQMWSRPPGSFSFFLSLLLVGFADWQVSRLWVEDVPVDPSNSESGWHSRSVRQS